jgi:hypothetical protein
MSEEEPPQGRRSEGGEFDTPGQCAGLSSAGVDWIE